MNITLSKDTTDLGVTPADVAHMLKACDKRIYVTTYEPTHREVLVLLAQALQAEEAKQRKVQKWTEVMSRIK
jgi:hypothetical protein